LQYQYKNINVLNGRKKENRERKKLNHKINNKGHKERGEGN
jgi:hypothetical protein